MNPAVEFVEVTKRFGPVTANEQVGFAAHPGEIHALVGENGAGKSTLMGILAGFVQPDSGIVRIDGVPAPVGSPRAMLGRGVGICAQHFHQVPTLTGYENIVLGTMAVGGRKQLGALMKRYGLDVPLDVPVERLSLGEQERIEILKLLYRDARILILDEPTAVLAASEVRSLFQILRRLAEEGRAILFVSHKLPEVMEIADRITVLRSGRVVTSRKKTEVTEDELVRLIVGGAPPPPARWSARVPGRPVLETRGLSLGRLAKFDVQVREGQIVGVGGVEGNGQQELTHALLGYRTPEAGTIQYLGESVRPWRSRRFRQSIGVIPEDRQREGLVLGRSLVENGVLGRHERAPFTQGGILRWGRMREHAESIVDVYQVRPDAIGLPAVAFSGGNQQRFIAGRELTKKPPFLLAVHPTRGVDLKATQFLHGRLLEERTNGAAILLVSADLQELQTLADRVLILYRGQVAYSASREEIDPERMQRALLGLAGTSKEGTAKGGAPSNGPSSRGGGR